MGRSPTKNFLKESISIELFDDESELSPESLFSFPTISLFWVIFNFILFFDDVKFDGFVYKVDINYLEEFKFDEIKELINRKVVCYIVDFIGK